MTGVISIIILKTSNDAINLAATNILIQAFFLGFLNPLLTFSPIIPCQSNIRHCAVRKANGDFK